MGLSTPPLDIPRKVCYHKGEGEHRCRRSYPGKFRLCNRNRHRPGWRFLRFTTMVTVKAPICNVIRMAPTSFRRMWANRLPLYALLPCWYCSRMYWACQRRRLTSPGRCAIIKVKGSTAVGGHTPESLGSVIETVTGQGGGFCLLSESLPCIRRYVT